MVESYVTVQHSDSDRSSCDSYHYPVIIINNRRFGPEHGRGMYSKSEATEIVREVASILGIEAKLEETPKKV